MDCTYFELADPREPDLPKFVSWGGGSKKPWSGRGASHAKPARKVKISRMYSIDSERHCFFLTTEQTIFSDFGDFGV